MNTNEMRSQLEQFFRLRTPARVPSARDLQRIESLFGNPLPESFRSFLEQMHSFRIEAGILGVLTDDPWVDSIEEAYRAEVSVGGWPPHYLPIYDVGNGDYYVLNANEGPVSKIYYIDHEQRATTQEYDSFDAFVRDLPSIIGTGK